MPSLVGSIPDSEVAPVIAYFNKARQAGVITLDYNELLMCLLIACLIED